ncbi:hypothetical protein MKX01_040852 [Papaver californicum]|nr:hypothetical protein MKX01_040852 [Papaver californicum]
MGSSSSLPTPLPSVEVYLLLALWITLHLASVVTADNNTIETGGKTRHYTFNIQLQKVTRLCHTRSIVTVNGQFPGPRIFAREGDRVVVKVVNQVQNNITIHWHGIRQLRSGWYDGPAYVAQCPIQTGQRTLWWHVHISWLRSTLYGPTIILPKRNVPYPFVKPYKDVPFIFGEWFNADTEAIINQALQTGGGPNVSDAYTINGLPGPLFIANHTLKVVDADAVYVKPFETDTILLTPGQTSNVLLKAKHFHPHATFVMAARPYVTGQGTFDNSTTTGTLEYESSSLFKFRTKKSKSKLFKPTLPPLNDTARTTSFTKRFRSLASEQYPANVPKSIDRHFFFTVGFGTNPCPQNHTCQGPNGSMFSASVNNVSFALPTTALLQAHFTGQSNGVYSPYFPSYPTQPFNYTGNPPNNTNLIMQGTSILGAESHPLHLHGYNFFVVGQGFGNYDAVKRPCVWFMHCHLEIHTSWGLKMAWLVLDGKLPSQKLLPPPSDLPKC